MDYKILMETAKDVSKNSYSPYSKFAVGACVLGNNEKMYAGCNFENSSFGLTICAERNAIGSAIADGAKQIKAIAIYSPNMDLCLPCGACRQVLNEFKADDGDIDVIVQDGDSLATYKLSQLLPGGFIL